MLEMGFPPPPAKCGERRSARSLTRCELPPDHMVGGVHQTAERMDSHYGRDRAGRWQSWGSVQSIGAELADFLGAS
jgi:hypothetical protein